ncbi:MAG: tail fiber domain-containing protein [Bdellovibrionales bacterium]|jgi:hypothetical protein
MCAVDTARLDSRFRAVSFDWKKTGGHEVGVIAQEVYPLFPELVNKGDDDPNKDVKMDDPKAWGVMYDRFGPLALEGVKELHALVKNLKAENDDLRARIEKLEAHGSRPYRYPRLFCHPRKLSFRLALVRRKKVDLGSRRSFRPPFRLFGVRRKVTLNPTSIFFRAKWREEKMAWDDGRGSGMTIKRRATPHSPPQIPN